MPQTDLPPFFSRTANGDLQIEQVTASAIVDQFGSPTYVYSRAAIESAFNALTDAFGERAHRICYAVKANSNIGILSVLARLGAGFDIVSYGELARVQAAGGDPAKTVFSGVGKSADEIRGALAAGIGCLNVESEAELRRIAEIASEMQRIAPISLRVNPDVDARTHPYISTGLKDNKFGIAIDEALPLYEWAHTQPSLEIVGIDCHIGSQLTDVSPFRDAAERVMKLAHRLAERGIELKHLDLGGGLGIRYTDENPPPAADWIEAIRSVVDADPLAHDLPIWIEPGRFIAGPAGALVTRVEYLKPGRHKSFAIIDAAMNDLMRPALYGSDMAIVSAGRGDGDRLEATWEIVGPICETGDFLGHDRPFELGEGDLLAVLGAGAYGFSMASNYNTRPRAAEVLVDGDTCHEIRRREPLESLWALEQVPPAE
ncbi:diaminopimelate decarboxylase [Guyparkeria hydrothermalis]|uniref:diaminopimelate decarboxylase n=1 Tax=Guyparkeria hydrothermalis TaxID=923 RepID=UPI0032E51FB8